MLIGVALTALAWIAWGLHHRPHPIETGLPQPPPLAATPARAARPPVAVPARPEPAKIAEPSARPTWPVLRPLIEYDGHGSSDTATVPAPRSARDAAPDVSAPAGRSPSSGASPAPRPSAPSPVPRAVAPAQPAPDVAVAPPQPAATAVTPPSSVVAPPPAGGVPSPAPPPVPTSGPPAAEAPGALPEAAAALADQIEALKRLAGSLQQSKVGRAVVDWVKAQPRPEGAPRSEPRPDQTP